MLLNKLELLGFKSFPQKLKIEFGPGITCVVGPNGCGKTNIADAIRWALGEQSAKALRGGSMGDVIFNGTENRKPLGMAEVTLSFSNSRSLVPVDYDEIAVTRRVFRDGVSEYSLNKTPCRLKDIKDMFLDTGIGSHAYSLIEQEMVDHVLSDNSGHRRFLLEEAAGIMKYKTRKKEALLKLDATESDLLRVNDILVEIERETNSLRRQIAKARRFKRLETEVRELDVNLAVLEYNRFDEEVKKLSEEQQTCLARKGQVSGAITSLEASLEKLRLEVLEEEGKVTATANELAEVEERQTKVRDRVLVLKERRAALDSKCEGISEDIRHIEQKIETIKQRSQEATEELSDLRSSVEARTEEIARKDEELSLRERELQAAKSDMRAIGEQVMAKKTEEMQRLSKLEELSAMKDEIEVQLAATSDETAELEARLVELRSSREEQAEELARRRSRIAELESTVAESAAKRERLEKQIAELRKRDSALTGEVRSLEGRLSALENVAARHREAKETIRQVLSGVSGKVAALLEDLISIPSDISGAFDAILGEYGPIVVVDDRETALSCFSALERKSAGRFSVLSLEGAGEAPSRELTASLTSSPGVVGAAASLLKCPKELESALSSLLDGTIVVENVESLRDRALQEKGPAKLVTRDGRLTWGKGALTGGATSYARGPKVEKELEKARAKLDESRALLSDCSESMLSMEKEREEVAARCRNLTAESVELKAAMSSHERRLSVSEAEARLLENRLSPVKERSEHLKERLRLLDEQKKSLEGGVSGLRDSLGPESTRFDEQSSAISELETQRESLVSELSELRMADVREHARKNELLSVERRLVEERQVLVSEIERKEKALAETRATLAEGEEEMDKLEELASEVGEECKLSVGRLEAARASYNLLRKEASELEQRIREERKRLDQLSEEAHQLELSLTKQKIEREGVSRRIQAEYGIDLTVMPSPTDEFEQAEAEQELAVLREKLKSLGPVNLLALEEFEKKKERLDFIKNQRDDLTQAKTSLLEVIERINERASTLFLETYNSVQQKFRDTFRALFEGGDAELRLLGEDPLEGEIEIVARPRGKKLQSLNLLSGGEKALTAIALLFAIYLVKPSPFCILDEVDAPLDDANIYRFLSMLKTFNERTQFIIITHNKRTMEAADCLYGITMQEPGISKVVSVRLTGADEPAELVPEAVGPALS
jgi:chromosome segregation protein